MIYRVGKHQEVTTAALVNGEGIDLVVRRPGAHKGTTVQLSTIDALSLSRAIRCAAQESEYLNA